MDRWKAFRLLAALAACIWCGVMLSRTGASQEAAKRASPALAPGGHAGATMLPGDRDHIPSSGRHAAEPVDYWSLLFVFVLSTFIGLGVIGRVSRLLHTPLMSLTNAISAIAVVGAILVTGEDYPLGIRILGAIALSASMTNIVSGFLLTDRMLKMFKQTRTGAKG